MSNEDSASNESIKDSTISPNNTESNSTNNPTSSSGPVWICDICKVEKFKTYEEACEHEKVCKIARTEGAANLKSGNPSAASSETAPTNNTSSAMNPTYHGVATPVTSSMVPQLSAQMIYHQQQQQQQHYMYPPHQVTGYPPPYSYMPPMTAASHPTMMVTPPPHGLPPDPGAPASSVFFQDDAETEGEKDGGSARKDKVCIKQEEESISDNEQKSEEESKQNIIRSEEDSDHSKPVTYSCKYCKHLEPTQRPEGAVYESADGSLPDQEIVDRHLVHCKYMLAQHATQAKVQAAQAQAAQQQHIAFQQAAQVQAQQQQAFSSSIAPHGFYNYGMPPTPYHHYAAAQQYVYLPNHPPSHFPMYNGNNNSISTQMHPSQQYNPTATAGTGGGSAGAADPTGAVGTGMSESSNGNIGAGVTGDNIYPGYPFPQSSSSTTGTSNSTSTRKNKRHKSAGSLSPIPYSHAMNNSNQINSGAIMTVEDLSSPLPIVTLDHNNGISSGSNDDSDGSANIVLVLPEDRFLITDYFLYMIQQLKVCYFAEKDRKTRGGKRENIKVGFPGLQCKHCAGNSFARKFFWSDADRLANSFSEIPSHVMMCRMTPQEVKKNLAQLKAVHAEHLQKMPRGSQKKFIRRMWRRIHGRPDDGVINDDAPSTVKRKSRSRKKKIQSQQQIPAKVDEQQQAVEQADGDENGGLIVGSELVGEEEQI